MRWLLALSFLFSTTSLARNADRAYEIMKQAEESILRVELRNEQNESQGHGTAFVVKYKNRVYTITAAHVCGGKPMEMGYLTAIRSGKLSGKVYKLKILKISKESDLCLLQNPAGIEPLKIAPKVTKDEYVYVVGFPGYEFMTSTFGRVKAIEKADVPVDWITDMSECVGGTYHQHMMSVTPIFNLPKCFFHVNIYNTTAPTSPGASGGPALNDKGDVIGVVSMYNYRNMDWAQIIIANDLRVFLNNL